MLVKLNLLDNLIVNDLIIVGYEVKDYKDVIYKLCEFLVEKGIINYNYYDLILKLIEVYGLYYILVDGIVMLYVLVIENSVFLNGFSLFIFKKFIIFVNDLREVKIVMILVVKDGEIYIVVVIL